MTTRLVKAGASTVRIEWAGDELRRRIVDAATRAVDDTTEEAASVAKTTHWWTARTAPRGLTGQIVTSKALLVGKTISGRFGTTYAGKGRFSGFYGLFLEMRTPFLRPAADIAFPTLAEKIRRRLKNG